MSQSQVSRQIAKSFQSVASTDGDGARVYRSIGTPQLRNFHPFLMMDHFKVGKGAGFPNHPHRGEFMVK